MSNYIEVVSIDPSFSACGIAHLTLDNNKFKLLKYDTILRKKRKKVKKNQSILDIYDCADMAGRVISYMLLDIKDGTQIIFELPYGAQSFRAADCIGMIKGIMGAAIIVYRALSESSNCGCTHRHNVLKLISKKFNVDIEDKKQTVEFVRKHVSGFPKGSVSKLNHLADACLQGMAFLLDNKIALIEHKSSKDT